MTLSQGAIAELKDWLAKVLTAARALAELEHAGVVPPGIFLQKDQRNNLVPRKALPAPAAHRRKPLPDAQKTCRKCGKTKPLTLFPSNKNYKSGHTNECRDCLRTYQRAWRLRKRGPSAPVPKASLARPATSVELKYECKTCHTRFMTATAKKNHNCLGSYAEILDA